MTGSPFRLTALALAALLAGCGVNGAPHPPQAPADMPPSGVTVSGSARVGITQRL